MFTAALTGVLLLSAPVAANASERDATNDKAAIEAHIHSIFQAFIDQDRKTIEETHSVDWKGFQVSATELTRGREAYMTRIGFRNPMQKYEIEDIEIDVYGDVAVVYYVARWWSYITAIDQYLTQHARSVDIYRRDEGEWIQAGSNISLIPRAGAAQNDAYTEIFDADLLNELPQ